MLVYGLEDVFRRNGALGSIGLNQDHGLLQVEAMHCYLGLNRILADSLSISLKHSLHSVIGNSTYMITRKSLPFKDDLVPLLTGSIKT